MKGIKIGDESWQEISRRIKDGDKITDLAKEFGISTKTIYNRLGSLSNNDSSALEVNKLKRENKALKELVGKITFELNKEKKEI